MNMPRVTAVVLNYCNEEDTSACLASVAAQDYGALDVLLVDNHSPDGSGERLHVRHPDIAYLRTDSNLGYAGGNNRGIERALEGGTEFVLILNNDTVLETQCVSELVRAAQGAGDVGAVGPKILRFDDRSRTWFAGGFFDVTRAIGRHVGENERDAEPNTRDVQEAGFLTGCCLLIPAAVLRAEGYFREDFFAYVEDVEFCLRMTRSGRRLLYAPGARLLHRVPPPGTFPSPFQIRHRDRNRRRLVRLHYSAVDRIRFMAWFYPTRLALAAGYLLRWNGARAAAVIRGMTER